MYKVCNVDLERRREIIEGINHYCAEIISRLRPQPRAVILFGSFAKDDINEGSDIDILVISDFSENFLDRIKTLLELNRFKLPIEPIGYTPSELRRMRREGNPFLEEILTNCKVLYGDLPEDP